MKGLMILLATLVVPPVGAAGIALTPEQTAAFAIETRPATSASGTLSRPYPAEVVVPNEQLRVVAAPQAGVIEALLVAEGETVEAGQPMARLLSPGFLELQRAYLDALTGRRLAENDLNRNRALYREGIVAERRLLESRAEYQRQTAALEQARQALQLAGMDAADLQRLAKERRLSGALVVHAPLSGVVLEQMATAGQRVARADPLYRVAQLESLWVEIHVPLEVARAVRPGDAVRLAREGVSGRVIAVGRMVHKGDQGVLVRAEVRSGAGRLRPGQFAEVRLQTATAAGVRVPAASVVRHQGRTYLFKAGVGGFEPVPVEVLSAEGETALVRGAVAPGDPVVVRGTAALKAAWLGGGA